MLAWLPCALSPVALQLQGSHHRLISRGWEHRPGLKDGERDGIRHDLWQAGPAALPETGCQGGCRGLPGGCPGAAGGSCRGELPGSALAAWLEEQKHMES